MEYTERALSVQEQVDLLVGKGLECDSSILEKRLTDVSYHRLSGYWHTLRITKGAGDWCFRSGTKLADIWDRYTFDRQLRLLVFDAIERIEVAIRNDLILELAIKQGPFGYLEKDSFPNIEAKDASGNTVFNHSQLLRQAQKAYRRELDNANPSVAAFHNKHGDTANGYLPYWILLEIVEFGTLTRLVHGLSQEAKKHIAQKYGLRKISILDSWMDTLRMARNTTAHHGRLWNRKNVLKPQIPNKKNLEWHTPVAIEPVKDRTFGTLTILKYLMNYIAPQSGWPDRLETLFDSHPSVDRKLLGYPENWRDCPIWTNPVNRK